MDVSGQQERLPNLKLLLMNRLPDKVILLTSSPLRLTAAMNEIFCGVPVSQMKDDKDDFELELVENYLLQVNVVKKSLKMNREDFGYLLDEPQSFYQAQMYTDYNI